MTKWTNKKPSGGKFMDRLLVEAFNPMNTVATLKGTGLNRADEIMKAHQILQHSANHYRQMKFGYSWAFQQGNDPKRNIKASRGMNKAG